LVLNEENTSMTVLFRSFRVRPACAARYMAALRRVFKPVLWLGAGVIFPAQTTDPFSGLLQQLTQIFTSLITIAKTIAPAVGILGFIGLGVLYMGSSWPIISSWKQQNPQAVGNVMMGLFFVLFASLVVSIIPNPGGFQ
jgi:hypothetical protein